MDAQMSLLFAEPLNPVAPKAQAKVPVPEGLDLSGGERGRTAMRALSRGYICWKVGVMRAVRRWQLVGRGQHRVPLQ